MIRENVNEAIRAREVRAVFPDEIVIMPTLQAVRKARSLGLDLILIAPTAEPPVAKAMDLRPNTPRHDSGIIS